MHSIGQGEYQGQLRFKGLNFTFKKTKQNKTLPFDVKEIGGLQTVIFGDRLPQYPMLHSQQL